MKYGEPANLADDVYNVHGDVTSHSLYFNIHNETVFCKLLLDFSLKKNCEMKMAYLYVFP